MTAREMARTLGRRGGQARAQRLPAARKKQIASLGGTARARSLLAARRIESNFRYVDAIAALRGPERSPARRKRFNGRLPGIYPPRK